MININELRVGNWVTLEGGDGTQFQLKPKSFSNCDNSGVTDYDPIPITPEILEACGFEYLVIEGITQLSDDFDDPPEGDTYNWMISVPRNDRVEGLPRFELVKFGDGEIRFSQQWLRVTVKHLHDLQNLFFSMTRTELSYNPQTKTVS